MTEPIIDVLLAAYNGERFISEQIQSILNQTFADFRLLIRDDGSTDRTLAIVDAICLANPDRVSRISDKRTNLGAKGNFAAMLEHSQSNYVMFSDQDDIWSPDKIEATLAAMRFEEQCGHPADPTPTLIYTDVVVVDSANRELAPSYFSYTGIEATRTTYPALFLQNTVIGCTAMANRALLDRALPIPSGVAMHDWWLALVAVGTGRIAMLDRPTLRYRQHGSNEVGAWRYGLASILQLSPKRLQTARRNYRAAITQVDLLLERCGAALLPGQRLIAERFIRLSRLNWLMRRIEARRLGLRKSGVLRTMLLYALM